MATTITANGINFPDGSASAPSIGGTDTNTGLFTGSDIVGFATGGEERIRIDSSGNVLVGTTDTTLYSNTQSSGTGIMLRGGHAIDIARSADLQLTLNRLTNEGANIGLYQAGGLKGTIGTKSGGIYFGTDGDTERLRIKSDGNIIPGTNNATSIGDGATNFNSIWASTRFRGNDNVKLVLGSSQNLVIRYDGSNNIIGSPVANDLHIKSGTGDNDNQLIATFKHSNASVGIGTDSPANLLSLESSAPVLSIRDTASYSANSNGGKIYFQGTDSDGAVKTFAGVLGVSQSSNNGQLRLQTRTGGTLYDRLIINADGAVGIGTASPRGSSTYQGLELSGTSGGVVTFSVNHVEKWNVYGYSGVFGIYDRVNTRYNLKCHSDGNVELPSGNLKVTSGKGISFYPNLIGGGSGSGSPDPRDNTLDDYEEGRFDFTCTSGGLVLTNNDSGYDSHYVKIGRFVHIQFYIGIGSGTHTSSTLEFSGLPFDAAPALYSVGTIDFGKGGIKGNYMRVNQNSDDVRFYYPSENTSNERVEMVGNQIGTSTYMIGTMTYYTDADN